MDIFIHIKDRKRCNLALMEAMSVGLAWPAVPIAPQA